MFYSILYKFKFKTTPMKKNHLLVLGGLLLSVSLFLFPKYSYADDLYLSGASQLEGTGCLTAYSGYNHNQVFIPTYNVLTKVGVKMRNMNGGSVTLTVKNAITTQIVLTKTQRMGLGDGWIYFDLVDDALGYVVNSDSFHSIWISTSYYPSDAPCWVYTSSDVYSDGMRRQGLTIKDGDFTFATYGFDLDMGREDPEEDPEEEGETVMVVDEGDGEGESTAENSGSESETNSDTSDSTSTEEDSVESPDESQDVGDVVVEESDDVEAPVLDSVIKNQEVLEVDDSEDTVDVLDEDEVKITGTATGGDEVAVIIGEKAYTATADEDGNWYVLFSASDFEDGEYTVEAQSKDEDGKGSEKVGMFILSKSTVSESSDTVVADETEDTPLLSRLWNGDLWYISLSIALLCLGGLMWLLIFLIKRRKEKEEGKDKGKKNGIEKKKIGVK